MTVTVQFEIPQSVPPGMYSLSIVNANGIRNTENLQSREIDAGHHSPVLGQQVN
jgi:hypothetical protein